MFKKLREINEKNKTVYFFFILFVILAFLVYKNIFLGTSSKQCVAPDFKVKSVDMYEYEMKITKDGETILLNGKRYGSKIYIEKIEKGITSQYFIDYSNIYMKDSNGVYNYYNGNYIVNGVDNKYLYIEYISSIADSANVKNDEDSNLCYINDVKSVNICINENNETVNVEFNNISIQYKFSNAGKVEDFDIDVNKVVE